MKTLILASLLLFTVNVYADNTCKGWSDITYNIVYNIQSGIPYVPINILEDEYYIYVQLSKLLYGLNLEAVDDDERVRVVLSNTIYEYCLDGRLRAGFYV